MLLAIWTVPAPITAAIAHSSSRASSSSQGLKASTAAIHIAVRGGTLHWRWRRQPRLLSAASCMNWPPGEHCVCVRWQKGVLAHDLSSLYACRLFFSCAPAVHAHASNPRLLFVCPLLPSLHNPPTLPFNHAGTCARLRTLRGALSCLAATRCSSCYKHHWCCWRNRC